MKTTALLLCFALLCLTLTGNIVYATQEVSGDLDEPEVIVGIDPQSPFWFLQRWGEQLRLRLTFRQERKNALLLTQLQRREAELELLQQRLNDGPGNQRSAVAMERVTANYNKQMEKIALRIERTAEKHQAQAERLEQRLEKMLARQEERLEKVEELKKKHPDTPGLQRVLEKGRKGLEKQQKNKTN